MILPPFVLDSRLFSHRILYQTSCLSRFQLLVLGTLLSTLITPSPLTSSFFWSSTVSSGSVFLVHPDSDFSSFHILLASFGSSLSISLTCPARLRCVFQF